MISGFRHPALTVLLGLTLLGCGSLIVRQPRVEALEERKGFTWDARAVPQGGRVLAESGMLDGPTLESIAVKTNEVRREVMERLGVEAYDAPVTVFLVRNRERMRELIGRRTNATGFPASRTVCLVWPKIGARGLNHELVHVIGMTSWGNPERWVNEGLAVDLTGDWIGRPLDSACRSLRDQAQLPKLAELLGRFDSLPSAVSYPAAGSFTRFLREEHGMQVVRAIWREGAASLEASTGRTLEQLETAWLSRIAAAAAPDRPYDWRAVTPSD